MSSKENLKDVLKRANRLNQELGIENKKLKDEIGELEMRLYIQKLHCKLFHRQKISVWFINIYCSLKWWIKPKFNKNETRNI